MEDRVINPVIIRICQQCLDGKGGVCHTPGCGLYLHSTSAIPIHKELYTPMVSADYYYISTVASYEAILHVLTANGMEPKCHGAGFLITNPAIEEEELRSFLPEKWRYRECRVNSRTVMGHSLLLWLVYWDPWMYRNSEPTVKANRGNKDAD